MKSRFAAAATVLAIVACGDIPTTTAQGVPSRADRSRTARRSPPHPAYDGTGRLWRFSAPEAACAASGITLAVAPE
jgi:hypothetical protein